LVARYTSDLFVAQHFNNMTGTWAKCCSLICHMVKLKRTTVLKPHKQYS
jgi:hypothetical protein